MNRSTGILLPQGGLLTGELLAPAGTRMPFNQAAAPLGWTIDAASTLTDCTGVVKQANGGTTGGSTAWSGWHNGNTFSLNSFALSPSQLPSHSHTVTDPGHIATSGAHMGFTVQSSTGNTYTMAIGGSIRSPGLANTGSTTLNATIANAGQATPITPTYTTPVVKFTDHIIGVRS